MQYSISPQTAPPVRFDLLNLNDKPKAGLIGYHMRVKISVSNFVIADLAHDNFGTNLEAK